MVSWPLHGTRFNSYQNGITADHQPLQPHLPLIAGMQYSSDLSLVVVSIVRRFRKVQWKLASRFRSSIRRTSSSSPWCRSRTESKVSATKARVAQYCSTFVRGAAASGVENHVLFLCRVAVETLIVREADTLSPLTANCMVRDMAVAVELDVFAASGAIMDGSLGRGFLNRFITAAGWPLWRAAKWNLDDASGGH